MKKPDWKDEIGACFEDLRVVALGRREAEDQLAELTAAVVQPAFAGVASELKRYKVRCRYWRTRNKELHFQASFPRRREVQFEYILAVPRRAVELALLLTVRGRPEPGAPLQEESFPFLPQTPPAEILRLDRDALAHDIVARYKRFVTESAIDPIVPRP